MLIQSLPVPSAKAKARTKTPISSVRGSRQAASAPRAGAPSAAGSSGSVPSGTKARVARGTARATTAATISRCAVTGTCSATIAAPIRAPTTVPRLSPAWNRDMIERPRWRSTTAPWTFIATSQAPLPKPRKNSPITTGTRPPR
ncbi:hypothetical protein VSR01_36480 [Actinacidiphila sp. DG2A-62]|nr:hypothetical protein [Actinacidiphila sp. DG2A-62]MEC3998691.1 hypothetical protein [Actinacidiphila sp. DG2A-62]